MKQEYELLEEKFNELILGLTRKLDFDRWPNWIFFFRGDECLFVYDLNSGNLW